MVFTKNKHSTQKQNKILRKEKEDLGYINVPSTKSYLRFLFALLKHEAIHIMAVLREERIGRKYR